MLAVDPEQRIDCGSNEFEPYTDSFRLSCFLTGTRQVYTALLRCNTVALDRSVGA
jgi:hypothetical protein